MGLSLSCKRGNLQWSLHVWRMPTIMITCTTSTARQTGRRLGLLVYQSSQPESFNCSQKACLKKKKKKPWKAQKIHASSLCVHMWAHTNHKSIHSPGSSERLKSFFSSKFLNVSYGMLKPSTGGSPRAAGKASCTQSQVSPSSHGLPAGPV